MMKTLERKKLKQIWLVVKKSHRHIPNTIWNLNWSLNVCFTSRQTNWWTNLWKQDASLCFTLDIVHHHVLATTILCYWIIYFYGWILFRSLPLSVIFASWPIDIIVSLARHLVFWISFCSTWIHSKQSTTNIYTSTFETMFLRCNNLNRFHIDGLLCLSFIYFNFSSCCIIWYRIHVLVHKC